MKKYTRSFTVRCTEEELTKFHEEAIKSKMTLSEMVRKSLEHRVRLRGSVSSLNGPYLTIEEAREAHKE